MTRSVLVLLGVAASTTVALAADQQLSIDPRQSRIEAAVKATVDSFTAHVSSFTADIHVDSATGRVVRAVIDFNFHDLLTGKPKRDHEMHEWQHTPEHPAVHFELRELKPTEFHGSAAVGTLSLHGVAREIEFPVAVTRSDSMLAIDGEATLDVRDFGLAAIRKFAVLKVDPHVVVRFHLQGELNSLVASSASQP